MKYRWVLAAAQRELAGELAGTLKISALLAQCLVNRGLMEAEGCTRFLEPRLQHLGDPFLLPGMEAGVRRLFAARERGEAVVIFGDYDVDGVTATALLSEVLAELGWKVEAYLPNRLEEGYGLSQAGVENCLAKYPAKVLVAVDCGSTSAQTIDLLGGRGVDVLVVDHHQVSSPQPKAVALINPRAEGEAGWRFGELCSAGLAFKLAHALVKRGRELGLDAAKGCDVRGWLDLVALGTVADMVPLVGENRILVTRGLERLNGTKRPGLVALREVSRISSAIGGYEVGFQLAPRLNAAGRLETAVDSLDLLRAGDLNVGRRLAQRLDGQNRERQEIERRIAAEVIAAVRKRFNPAEDYVVVEGHPDWHVGVVGIVAARVLQEFGRPSIIFGGDGGQWRGSGRSIAGFDLAAALRECTDVLLRHGGHAMAAGVSVEPGRVDDFRRRLNECARRLLKPEDFRPVLRLDGEVSLGVMTLEQLKELKGLEPTGMGNPAVQLVARGLRHERAPQRLGAEGQHAKLWVTDGSAVREAVVWGVKDKALPEGNFDLAFTPQLNVFNGSIAVQLRVLDWAQV